MPYAQPRLIKKEHSVNAEKGSAAARVNPAYLRGAVRRGSSPWQVPACAFCRDPFTWWFLTSRDSNPDADVPLSASMWVLQTNWAVVTWVAP
jgi:hypothetical protein